MPVASPVQGPLSAMMGQSLPINNPQQNSGFSNTTVPMVNGQCQSLMKGPGSCHPVGYNGSSMPIVNSSGQCQPVMGNHGQCGSMPNTAQTNMPGFMGPMGNNPTQCHSMPSPAQANAGYLGPAMPTSPANCYGASGQTSQQLSQQPLTSPAAGAPAPQQANTCWQQNLQIMQAAQMSRGNTVYPPSAAPVQHSDGINQQPAQYSTCYQQQPQQVGPCANCTHHQQYQQQSQGSWNNYSHQMPPPPYQQRSQQFTSPPCVTQSQPSQCNNTNHGFMAPPGPTCNQQQNRPSSNSGHSAHMSYQSLLNNNVTEIQCQDISQSSPNNGSAVPVNVNSTNVPVVTGNVRGMRQDTYQRTLEYVQQCQSWAGSDMVSSSTHPLGPEASSHKGPLQGSTSNMVINDMTSSLTSLLEENRYLQMIQ